jgi:hypothetical protein
MAYEISEGDLSLAINVLAQVRARPLKTIAEKLRVDTAAVQDALRTTLFVLDTLWRATRTRQASRRSRVERGRSPASSEILKPERTPTP